LPARLLIALGCLVVTAAGAAPASAASHRLYAPSDATMPARPFAAPVRDDAPAGPGPAPRASAAAVQSFYSTDGQGPVRVDLSSSYGSLTQERIQPYVDFLASRLHGPELSRLTLFIVTPAEVRKMCSEQALACYLPRLELMIIPGEQTPPREVPVEYVITHEYGHHVAANRDNDPWPAVAYGPKGWATQEEICSGVASERYFPGDQGENYVRNPGENWAEAYAQLHYRGQFPWQYAASLSPTDASFAAVQADVLAPWDESVARRFKGKRLSGSRRSQTFKVRTTLDGRVKVTLRGPKRANFDIQILRGRSVRAASERRGSQDRLEATDCQVRGFSVRVVRRSGAGKFMVRIQTPG
jgi:hypothetical protein